jgi:hypothetical protein
MKSLGSARFHSILFRCTSVLLAHLHEVGCVMIINEDWATGPVQFSFQHLRALIHSPELLFGLADVDEIDEVQWEASRGVNNLISS